MGSQLAYYGRRRATECWLKVSLSYRIRAGQKIIRVPEYLHEAPRLVRDWAESWKTTVMRQHFDNRLGVFIDVGTNVGETLLPRINLFERI